MATKSDISADSTERYQHTVREYLRTHGEVVSKEELRACTWVPAWYIEQIALTARVKSV